MPATFPFGLARRILAGRPPVKVAMNPFRGSSPPNAADAADPLAGKAVRKREVLAFIVLAIVIWPFLAVAVVGGYGFVVWMLQLIFGPPGPPPV